MQCLVGVSVSCSPIAGPHVERLAHGPLGMQSGSTNAEWMNAAWLAACRVTCRMQSGSRKSGHLLPAHLNWQAASRHGSQRRRGCYCQWQYEPSHLNSTWVYLLRDMLRFSKHLSIFASPSQAASSGGNLPAELLQPGSRRSPRLQLAKLQEPVVPPYSRADSAGTYWLTGGPLKVTVRGLPVTVRGLTEIAPEFRRWIRNFKT